MEQMPSLMDHWDPVTWKVYPAQYIYAEKLQTFVERGSLNSRGKDCFDLLALYHNEIIKNSFVQPIKDIFEARETVIPFSFYVFSKSVNTELLESSWKSIESRHSIGFESFWPQFQKHLFDLDELFEK